jgi:tRNA(fMet)-specific endonuclease VapC
MTRWMLDTNAVSYASHRRSAPLVARLLETPTEALCVSSVSYGESMYGLAHRRSHALEVALADFFQEVEVLPWTQQTAVVYGELRAAMRRIGRGLQPLDMLITAHALEAGAVLVSSDSAFRYVPGLTVEDWTAA